jgi:bifunctional DNA-binding transcriptional regulator/antitoxin component of YhaV-PrlF toxin-antitoxin module
MALPRGTHDEDSDRMASLTRALPTKAAKIRALAAAGYTRTAIAASLGISYQHVRNVLVRDEEKAAQASAAPEALASEAPHETTYGRARIDEEGRVLLPAKAFAHLKLRPGGIVGWRIEGDEVILMGVDAGLREMREMLRTKPLGPGESAVDELIRERREEARKEEEELERYRQMDS